MRILHLVNHCDETGNGIVNSSVDLACGQRTLGHEVHVGSSGGAYQEILAENKICHTQLKLRDWRPWNYIIELCKLYRCIMRFDPQVVHAHMMAGTVSAWLLRPFFKYRLVTTVHNEFQKSAFVMRLGDVVIAVSGAVAKSLIRRGFNRNCVVTVLNGPLGSYRLPKMSSVPCTQYDVPTIISVAGLYPRKGLDDLINAFSIVRENGVAAQLLIIGEGPDRDRLEALARISNAGDSIHFLGFQRDPRTFMKGAHVFVLASHSEPFGLVLLEARECGCATIGTRVGGIPEALDHGKGGIIVPAQRPDILAAKISTLLNDPEKLKEAQHMAQNNLIYFNIERMVFDTLSAYLR